MVVLKQINKPMFDDACLQAKIRVVLFEVILNTEDIYEIFA